ncbi:MAG: phosphoribosylaminoimidazolesuccinocarboxamide synthase [Acidobacteriota bacterium]
MQTDPPLLELDIPELRLFRRGKVRDVYEVDERQLLFVASDRISAFDCVLPQGIPFKGKVLNQLSVFWFGKLREIVSDHFLTDRIQEYPAVLQNYRDQLAGRSMLVRRTRPLPVECVVRGYLAGSGWKEYRQSGSVCGLKLPQGLKESSRLPAPIFTPSTKAEVGHDENISFEITTEMVGRELAEEIRDLSLALYTRAADYAAGRGIVICDTKFEFGVDEQGVRLIDEVLTPDSSRFWPADQYRPGRPQPSFDKQYVRDYLETLDWDKKPPAPPLPAEVVTATARRYLEAYRQLTGHELAV